MRNVLILGAGIYQVPLIRKAKELGYQVLVCSIPGNYPGLSISDKVFLEDTTDKEACLRIAKDNNIAAVCTAGTDVALPTLGYIVDQLGLRGPSENTSLYSSNKLLMKEAFLKYNVSTAKFKKVNTFEECCDAVKEIGIPCVLKVVDSSGSRGIQIVREESFLHNAYESVKPYTKKDYILVEEFLEGEEFGAQAFIYEGKVYFVMPHSDEVFQGNTGVPIGHSVPLEEKLWPYYDAIQEESIKAIKALGIDNCAVNLDFMLMKGTPYVLEVGARCGATGLAELVSLYYGIDYYEIIFKAALGELDVSLLENLKPIQSATALLVTSKIAGNIESFNERVHDEKLYNFTMDYNVGDRVNAFKIGPDRIGQIVVYGDNINETKKLAHKLLLEVNLKISESKNQG